MRYSGAVEVFHLNRWFRVFPSTLELKNSDVSKMCRLLGFPDVERRWKQITKKKYLITQILGVNGTKIVHNPYKGSNGFFEGITCKQGMKNSEMTRLLRYLCMTNFYT